MDATPELTDDDHTCRSCVGAFMDDVFDRAQAQLEVIILGSVLRKPTHGSMEALRRVTRYLVGTRDASLKLEGSELGPFRQSDSRTSTVTGQAIRRRSDRRVVCAR